MRANDHKDTTIVSETASPFSPGRDLCAVVNDLDDLLLSLFSGGCESIRFINAKKRSFFKDRCS